MTDERQSSDDDVGDAPPDSAARDGSSAGSKTSDDAPAVRSRRRQARPSEGGDMLDGQSDRGDPRVQRTVRLSREIDAMIRALAQHRGIDLNAAISVAIASDFDRVFGPPPRPPEIDRR
jgi:hypothetical protein